MKTFLAFVVSACAFCFIAAPAAGSDKGQQRVGEDAFVRFDVNRNGVLDPEEIAAMREAHKKGDVSLKKYDTNNDGVLDDNEIAAMQPPDKGKKKKK